MFIFYLILISAEYDHSKCNTICFLNLYMKCLLAYLFLGFLCSIAADSFQIHCAIICLGVGVGAAHLDKCDVIVVTIKSFSR